MAGTSRTRGRETVADMLRSTALVGAVVLLLFAVVWWQRPEGAGDPVRGPVDAESVVAAVQASGPFPVLSPRDLGDAWRATSAWFRPDDPDVGGAVFHLGYLTPDGSYAQVRQTDADRDDTVREWVGVAEPVGDPVTLAGLEWQRLQTAVEGSRALVAVRGAGPDQVVIVVDGKADWPELEELAASLG